MITRGAKAVFPFIDFSWNSFKKFGDKTGIVGNEKSFPMRFFNCCTTLNKHVNDCILWALRCKDYGRNVSRKASLVSIIRIKCCFLSVKAFWVDHSEFHLFQAIEKEILYKESTIKIYISLSKAFSDYICKIRKYRRDNLTTFQQFFHNL